MGLLFGLIVSSRIADFDREALIMINIEFKDDKGRSLRSDQVGEYIEDSLNNQLQVVLKEQAESLAREHGLSTVVCSVHGITASNWRLEPVASGSDQLGLAYDECCNVLVKAIDERIPK